MWYTVSVSDCSSTVVLSTQGLVFFLSMLIHEKCTSSTLSVASFALKIISFVNFHSIIYRVLNLENILDRSSFCKLLTGSTKRIWDLGIFSKGWSGSGAGSETSLDRKQTGRAWNLHMVQGRTTCRPMDQAFSGEVSPQGWGVHGPPGATQTRGAASCLTFDWRVRVGQRSPRGTWRVPVAKWGQIAERFRCFFLKVRGRVRELGYYGDQGSSCGPPLTCSGHVSDDTGRNDDCLGWCWCLITSPSTSPSLFLSVGLISLPFIMYRYLFIYKRKKKSQFHFPVPIWYDDIWVYACLMLLIFSGRYWAWF